MNYPTIGQVTVANRVQLGIWSVFLKPQVNEDPAILARIRQRFEALGGWDIDTAFAVAMSASVNRGIMDAPPQLLFAVSVNADAVDRYPGPYPVNLIYVRATSANAALRWLLANDERFAEPGILDVHQLSDLVEVPPTAPGAPNSSRS